MNVGATARADMNLDVIKALTAVVITTHGACPTKQS
jgi:hypothetical protein